MSDLQLDLISKAKQNRISVEERYQLGCLYLMDGDLTCALTHLHKTVQLDPNNSLYHQTLANAYLKNKQFDKVEKHLLLAIELDGKNAAALNDLAAFYHKKSDLNKALHYYIKSTHAKPELMVTHENLTKLLLQLGRFSDATKSCQNILALQSDSVFAHYQLANLYQHFEKLPEAKEAYLKALEANPYHLECLNNLGTIALKENEGQKAIDYFTKALAIDNDFEPARSNIAATFVQFDRHENAINHYLELLRISPLEEEYLYNMAICQMNLGHLDEAIFYFKKLLTQNPVNQETLVNLGAIAIKQKNKREAIDYLQEALKINPHDESAHHMLSALTQKEASSTPKRYIKNLFDNYAINYESHLTKELKYNVPNAIETRLKSSIGKTSDIEKIGLDLGCGTGLLGYVLKPFTNKLIGVDLSRKMLEIARKKDLYDELQEACLKNYLKFTPYSFDLVVAGDVFNYLGELDSVFPLIKNKLGANGKLIFTVEISKNKPYQLEETGRFSHSLDYLTSLATEQGLHQTTCEIITARLQDGEKVKAYLIELQNGERNE